MLCTGLYYLNMWNESLSLLKYYWICSCWVFICWQTSPILIYQQVAVMSLSYSGDIQWPQHTVPPPTLGHTVIHYLNNKYISGASFCENCNDSHLHCQHFFVFTFLDKITNIHDLDTRTRYWKYLIIQIVQDSVSHILKERVK